MTPNRVRICAVVGCPNEVPCPTPGHSRPKNAHWSTDRDRGTQARFRKATLERDGYRCQRCGLRDPSGRALDAHHASGGHGVTLCNPCHVEVDPTARRRTISF